MIFSRQPKSPKLNGFDAVLQADAVLAFTSWKLGAGTTVIDNMASGTCIHGGDATEWLRVETNATLNVQELRVKNLFIAGTLKVDGTIVADNVVLAAGADVSGGELKYTTLAVSPLAKLSMKLSNTAHAASST